MSRSKRKPRLKTFLESYKEIRKPMPRPTKVLQKKKEKTKNNDWQNYPDLNGE